MKRTGPITMVCAVVGSTWMLAQASPAQGQEMRQAESGGSLYKTYCTSCHGPAAKGDGAVAPFLKVPPADLTQIAKRNNGTFPVERVAQTIEGRRVVRTHGPSEMPIWGDAFAKTVSGSDPASVKAKIEALVEYLESIQEKPAGRP